MRALLIYPTHANCDEVEEAALGQGLSAAVYPARKAIGDLENPPNCWNAEADDAEKLGFPVVKTVCPLCPQRQRCRKEGYLGQLIAVQQADVALCTHKRAEYTGLADLSAGRHYVSIHENPIDVLRPRTESSEADIGQMAFVVNHLLNDPRYLNWFGAELRVDDEGNECRDEEPAVRRERLYVFCHHLVDLLDDLQGCLRSAEKIMEWKPAARLKRADGIERLLFHTTKVCRAKFDGQPWRFLLAAAAGDLHSSAILVTPRRVKGATAGTVVLDKTVVGFRNNQPPTSAVTWFNDATLTVDRLQSILGMPVRDHTPGGHLALQKKAVQIVRDLTRATSSRVAASILRGVLADRPQFARIGVIGHRPHLAAITTLEPEFAARIVRTTYFGSGEERSSNVWHQECDLIVIAGTPRVPPNAVGTYLVQIGDVGAAARDPTWGELTWSGITESGEPVRVESRGYYDEAWRNAHRDLVRAELVQAIGRGRGILADGCEVLVLSNEECGLVLSDAGLDAINQSTMRVLAALRGAVSPRNANKYSLGKTGVSTPRLAHDIGLSISQTRDILARLERRGSVRKVGERKGWLPIETGESLLRTD